MATRQQAEDMAYSLAIRLWYNPETGEVRQTEHPGFEAVEPAPGAKPVQIGSGFATVAAMETMP